MKTGLWLAGLVWCAACGGGGGNASDAGASDAGRDAGGDAGADAGSDAGTGQTGSGASSVTTTLPSDPVNYLGDAVAIVSTTQGAATIRVLIDEGSASCASPPGIVFTPGKHSLELYVIRNGDHPAALTARTYASSDSSDPGFPTHVEAYLSNLTQNSNSGSCEETQYAGNGGDADYSLTVSELDATHVAGSYNITIAHGHEAGAVVSGTFTAPICSTGGFLGSCP